MNWSNIKLIFLREVRDQLRDRRTLFMIAVLPMLLYPLMGLSFLQIAQFMGDQPTKIWIIGSENLPAMPPLIEAPKDGEKPSVRRFDPSLFPEKLEKSKSRENLELTLSPAPVDTTAAVAAKAAIDEQRFHAVVEFPPDFAARLERFRQAVIKRDAVPNGEATPEIPQPIIHYDASRDKSQLAYGRVSAVLSRWTDAIGQQYLKESDVPVTAARPFEFKPADVATDSRREAVMWSKVLPFMLLIWALTGAFYPAIDLCAGEKERGTLETLLSCPAERTEIVTGKLLTIMLFSVATAVLNLLSMGLTGLFVIKQFASLGGPMRIGLPPLDAPLWMFVTLLPISALFSALCLALAAFARSTKEGQYYLMPLLLITMPLMMLPMAPGVELNLGNSLIPVTGVFLLLRELLEGDYVEAARFALPVIVVTGICCVAAMRWAVDQFNKESVLFRESERLDLGLWLRHLIRDREEFPTAAQVFLCAIIILVLRFFFNLVATQPTSFAVFAQDTIVMQIAAVATPALLMAIMLTSNPLRTLLIRRPPWLALPAAMLLAFALYPSVVYLGWVAEQLYPLNPGAKEQLEGMTDLIKQAPHVSLQVLLLGCLPAIVEELAFRGFILSGFRRLGHKWQAIILSSVFFGITHLLLQQSLISGIVGIAIGYIAVQTGSLWPGALFHATHNSIGVLTSNYNYAGIGDVPGVGLFFSSDAQGHLNFLWPSAVAGLIVAVPLLYWFSRLAYRRTDEEVLQDALDHQVANPLADA